MSKGVGTTGAMGALASAMLKPRGRKYLFAPAIICQVYQLVDSQTIYTQFCIAGLHESSPELPKMH